MSAMQEWLLWLVRWGAAAFLTVFTSVLIGCCISASVRTACVVNGLAVLLWSADRSKKSSVKRTADGAHLLLHTTMLQPITFEFVSSMPGELLDSTWHGFWQTSTCKQRSKAASARRLHPH